jgi:magnesium transporter
VKFKINKFLEDDIQNSEHPSDFEITDEYSVLILRLPYIQEENVKIHSYAFLIKEKIFIYNREKKDFEELGDFNDLYKYLDIRIDKILAKINSFQLQIAKLEDNLYDDSIDKNFANEWVKIKKELVLIERLMQEALIAFERFLKYYKLESFEFKDLHEHLQRALNYSKAGIDKLNYLYDFFRAKQDEKMNKIMFVLTLLSGIFLPLTLVTGYFGMNTGGLPWVEDNLGTLKATIVGVLLEIPIVIMLWRMMK